MVKRPYNFGAGPATLPESILLEAQSELLDWHHEGVSILEIGHRSSAFIDLMEEAAFDFRALLHIPNAYHVLFLGTAARSQFSMIPLNFLSKSDTASYIISGVWSSQAFEEAHKLKTAYGLQSQDAYDIPDLSTFRYKKNTAYVYYTPNETINGIRIATPPETNGIPLIADMTSCLLSEPICITDYDLIFAGAQKNISSAGLTIAIIHERMLERIVKEPLPTIFDYRTHALHRSLYATPPMFQCYLAAKMFKWLIKEGGIEAFYALNCQKAKILYDFIDSSSFYECRVKERARSLMNVCFSITNPQLEATFLQQSKAAGLVGLQGHRLVGAFRASLYNAMPLAGVHALIEFMQDFANQHTC